MPKAKPLPPFAELKELLHYCPNTGAITWKVAYGKEAKGSSAARYPKQGYLRCRIDGEMYLAHRIAWLLAFGDMPQHLDLDHVNGTRSDNRLINLRLCTQAQNNANAGLSCKNTSGFKGVYWNRHRKKWRAQISCKNKRIYLGSFDTPELAHMAYCKAAAELHGEFARG